MAPDAPAPTYDSHGNMVAEWSIRFSYDSLRDRLEVTASQEAGPYHKATRETRYFEVVDVEDALAFVQQRARICGARRLF